MDSISDNALILQLKDGQTDKLGLLFERYNKGLYGFFYRLTSDSDASEDLVQNVFIKILKYKHTYHGDGKFSTWMFHMARNMFADHYKKMKRRGYKEDVNYEEELSFEELQSEVKVYNSKNELIAEGNTQDNETLRKLVNNADLLSENQDKKYFRIAE